MKKYITSVCREIFEIYITPNERHLINQSDKQLLKIQSVKHGKSFSIVIQTNSHFLVPRPLFRAANVVRVMWSEQNSEA